MAPVHSRADTVWHQPPGSPRRFLLAPLTRRERNLFRRDLVAAGATWDDPAVHRGLAWMASRQFLTSAFDGFGLPDPNSTAMAMLAVTAAGFDPTTSCWRDTVAPARVGAPYGDPQAWLLAQQQPDGRVVSPNDTYGVNTFATAQSVEGWLRTWVPLVRATGSPVCAPSPEPDPEPRFTG